MQKYKALTILVLLSTTVLLTTHIHYTMSTNRYNRVEPIGKNYKNDTHIHPIVKHYAQSRPSIDNSRLKQKSGYLRNGCPEVSEEKEYVTGSSKPQQSSPRHRENKSSIFNVRFKFDIPLRRFAVANDTGLPDQRRGNITAENVGTVTTLITFKYRVSPANKNITIKFSLNNFVLNPGEKKIVGVNISVEKYTVSGEYNVSIIASTTQYPPPEPNPITFTQEYLFYIEVGGEACSFTVRLWQPDMKPSTQPRGLIRVGYISDNFVNYLYRDFGPNATFYVVAGHYMIEVWYRGTPRAHVKIYIVNKQTIMLEESNVDTRINGTIIDIIFSLLVIKDVAPVSQQLRSKSESLIFRFTVRNDDPLIYKNVVEIWAYLYRKSDGSLILKDVKIAELTIRSIMVETIIGSLPAPEDGWENDTYILKLVANKTVSGGRKLEHPVTVATNTTEISIKIVISAPTIEKKYIPLTPLLLAALIAGLIGFLVARGTTKIIRPKSYAPFKIRRVGIIARGSLIGFYDFTRRIAMIMNEIDRYYPSLIALIRGMESLRPPSWVMELPLPITWNIWAEKFMIYPIDSEFSLLVSTDPRVNERDPKVIRTLQTLAEYVGRMHAESRLTYDYIMKHQREYRLYVRRVADMVRAMGLATKPTRGR